jgi:hypothetical protein
MSASQDWRYRQAGPQICKEMEKADNLPPNERFKIGLNPFHYPGQRQIGAVRMPNIRSGFVFYIQAYKDIFKKK